MLRRKLPVELSDSDLSLKLAPQNLSSAFPGKVDPIFRPEMRQFKQLDQFIDSKKR